MRSRREPGSEAGFSLIELLVVVIIIGILAAIAIPRFLEQRQAAWNTAAVSDLRNLAAIQTSLEAAAGLSEDPGTIAAEGWEVSDSDIVACADLRDGDTDVVIGAWHVSGSVLYTWQRSDGRVLAEDLPPPADCLDAIGGVDPTRVD